MGYFDSLAAYWEDQIDPEAGEADRPLGRQAFRALGPPEAKRAVLQELAPETEGYLERFGKGFAGDVQDYVQGLGTIIGSVLFHPVQSAEAVGRAALHPLDTAKTLGSALVEPYIPEEDESFVGNLAEQVIDHPFRTLMDASTLLAGTGMLAKGASVGGRIAPLATAGNKLVAASNAIDPVYQAVTRGVQFARTHVPGLATTLDAKKALQQIEYDQKLAHDFAATQAQERLYGPGGVFEGLTPEDKAIFHPWVTGRVELQRPVPGGQLGEMVPFDEAQFGRLSRARERYMQVLADQDVAMGWDPDTVAREAGTNALAQLGDAIDPADPVAQQAFETAYKQKFVEATQARQDRIAGEMKTTLQEARQAEWQAAVDKIRAENVGEMVAGDTAKLPANPTLVSTQEAMDHLATQGGLYFPHSGEVLTREQATIRNLLTKRREALPWKMNTGAMYRSGLITEGTEEFARAADEGGGVIRYVDPGQVLERMQTQIAMHAKGQDIRGLMDTFAQKMGTPMKRSQIGTDPDIYAGKAQPFWPNGRFQMYALQHEAENLRDALMAHADDPAVANLNLYEQVEKAAKVMDKTIAVRTGPVYKIPTEAGLKLEEYLQKLQPPTSVWLRAFDQFGDAWRFTTLPLRPMWVMNNMVGNTVFNAMYGMHPFNPAAYSAYFDAFRGTMARKFGWFGEEGAKLADVQKLPGVAARGLYAQESGTRTGAALMRAENRLGAIGKLGPGHFADAVASFNEGVENFYRSAATLYGLKQSQKAAMKAAGKSFMEAHEALVPVSERVAQLKQLGLGALKEADYADALAKTNKWLNDYSKQTVWQRRVLRRVMPFQAFYRHAARVALHYPFERPVQAGLVRAMATVAKRDIKDQLDLWGFDWRDMPEWLRDAIPVDVTEGPDGRPAVLMASTRGPNPLSVMGAADPGADALQSLHPLVKVGIETITGVDLFRLDRMAKPLATYSGQQVDPATGAVMRGSPSLPERILEAPEKLARQFWPYQEARQLLARGREPTGDASLLAMLRHAPGTFRRDATTGREIRHPTPGAFRGLIEGPILPTLRAVEQPSARQRSARDRVFSDELNRLGRLYPELQPRIRRLLMEQALKTSRERTRLRPFRGLRPE